MASKLRVMKEKESKECKEEVDRDWDLWVMRKKASPSLESASAATLISLISNLSSSGLSSCTISVRPPLSALRSPLSARPSPLAPLCSAASCPPRGWQMAFHNGLSDDGLFGWAPLRTLLERENDDGLRRSPKWTWALSHENRGNTGNWGGVGWGRRCSHFSLIAFFRSRRQARVEKMFTFSYCFPRHIVHNIYYSRKNLNRF